MYIRVITLKPFLFFTIRIDGKGISNKVNQKGASCYTIGLYRKFLMLKINYTLKKSKNNRQKQNL